MITPLQYDNKKPSQILTKSNEWFVRAITDTKIRLKFFQTCSNISFCSSDTQAFQVLILIF